MPRTETISSTANPLIRNVRRAIASGGLTEDGLAVAETFHLLEEALRSDCEIPAVLAGSSAEPRLPAFGLDRVIVVPDKLMQSLSATEKSQGVIALVRPRRFEIEQVFGNQPLVVILDGLQDPGNAGTIVRCAEAFGATGVLGLPGTASPHNPKMLRASAGSLFRVPFVQADPATTREVVLRRAIALYGAVPARDVNPPTLVTEADLTAPCGVVIGNEARGIGREMLSMAREVTIPTVGVESLNAAIAAGILLYEARRQRMLRR